MPLKESYVIWNNKGGVGKSTLAFHMATHYSRREASVNVLVIDLCPQANVSMALLTTPTTEGSARLSSLYKQKKTVSFYLQKSLEAGPMVDSKKFLTRVRDHNHQVPSNLFLLCGDMYLELVGRNLQHVRSGVPLRTNNPWVNVTTSMRNFIEGLEEKTIGVAESDNDWVVFIDTNPSFSVYTEIAIAAARKLIIPINADDFSVEAVRAMLDLVFGIRQDEDEPEDFTAYRAYMFSYRASQYGLRRPQIHYLINNRTTIRDTRSTKAFRAMGDQILNVLFEAFQAHQTDNECFAPRESQQINDIATFKKQYFEDLEDFHKTAIQCLHSGCPLGALTGSTKFGDGAKTTVPVDKAQVAKYLSSLDRLIRKL